MFGLSGIKWAAIGGAILAGLAIIWRILAHQEKLGEAKAQVKQDREAKKAKAKMDAAKEVKGEKDTLSDLDSGKF